MSDGNPQSWHGAYGGNEESSVYINPEKFVGSVPPSLDVSQRSELLFRIKETQQLIKRSESEGEANWYRAELKIMEAQMSPVNIHINIKGNNV